MECLNVPLDPSRTGREAESLEAALHQRIVGQDEAIGQIVNIYQMFLTGMAAPGRPIGKLPVSGTHGIGQDAGGRGYGGEPGRDPAGAR